MDLSRFSQAFDAVNNQTTTDNGAVAFKSTTDRVLDFFGQMSAFREQPDEKVVGLFYDAFQDSPELAMRALFNLRDVRGGQGERDAFRVVIRSMAVEKPMMVLRTIHLIPQYGRWDDLYALVDTPLEDDMFSFLYGKFVEDQTSKTPSLLAKWLKSENASSKETKRLATKTRKAFGLSSAQYRKSLSKLRTKINVVEQKISSNKWADVDYPTVPSNAMFRYRNAFIRNDGDRYNQFISDVQTGDAKMNASVLFPYEIMRIIEPLSFFPPNPIGKSEAAALEATWDSLPNYVGDGDGNTIVVVDTSGSMCGLPCDVATSLGLYFAEHNSGAFKNKFITFSSDPSIVEIERGKRGDFAQDVRDAFSGIDWGMNTNLESVFELILRIAIVHEVPRSEMPKRLIIITDMQFDQCVLDSKKDVITSQSAVFYTKGYDLPNVVFWNVGQNIGQIPTTKERNGVSLVSGFSPTLFETIIKSETVDPISTMLGVLNDKRYDLVGEATNGGVGE